MPAVRKFGTSLHNIPKKTGKTPVGVHPGKASTKTKTHNAKSVQETEEIQVQEQLIEIVDVQSLDIATEVKTIVEPSDMHYDRNFLLSFSQISSPAIEGLIPEIVRGYIHPNVDTPRKNMNSTSRPRKTPHSAKKLSATAASFESPLRGASHHLNGCVTAPVSRTLTIDRDATDSVARSLDFDAEPDAVKTPSKAKKAPKPRETDVRRLAARQKQLDIGKNTTGYQKWLMQASPDKRNAEGPRMPDLHQICSKRSWDGQVRKWRRELHLFDPEGTPMPEGDDGADDVAEAE